VVVEIVNLFSTLNNIPLSPV